MKKFLHALWQGAIALPPLLVSIFILGITSSAYAQSVIHFTTTKKPGDKIMLAIKASEMITQSGLSTPISPNGIKVEYRLSSSKVTLIGNISELICDNNEIVDLDLSNARFIQKLNCSGNKISQLNLSKLTSLTEINCANNALETINVSSNYKLQKLFLQENKLTKIDGLTSSALEEIHCYKNQLKGIELTLALNNLPNREGKKAGKIYFLETLSTKEGNKATRKNVTSLKNKNWSILEYTGKEWRPYEGIEEKRAEQYIKLTSSQKIGKTIQLKVRSKGNLMVEGVEEEIIPDGELHRYTLNKAEVTLYGEITNFFCGLSKVTDLDVTHAPLLDTLVCTQNELTTLDISKNKKLKNLNCWKNRLSTLDISSCPELVVLHCSKNKLSELDLSQNPKLGYIDCARNQITSLDFSQNAEIEDIYCQNNKITAPMMAKLVKSLPDRFGKSRRGEIYVVDRYFAKKMGDNICLKTEVALALKKHWAVFDFNGANPTKYKGSDPIYPEGKISFESFQKKGDKLTLTLYAIGEILLEGIEEPYKEGTNQYTLTDNKVTIYGKLIKLECPKQKIKSLNLAGCKTLKELHCQENQMASLDLSRCIALEKVNCAKNQIEIINLQECKALCELICDHNLIKTLDFDDNSPLTSLHCEQNQISRLDLRAQKELATLLCSNNQMTMLDLSKNENIKRVDASLCRLKNLKLPSHSPLEELNCQENLLPDINLLNLYQLKTLLIGENPLQTLNVSMCKKLESLNCTNTKLQTIGLLNNRNLKYFDCSHNEIYSLDLTNNEDLLSLSCAKNSLQKLDLTHNTKIQILYCDHNRIKQLLFKALPHLTILNCANNKLSSLEIPASSPLNSLYCANNELGTLDLIGCEKLTTLSCQNNKLTKLSLASQNNLEKIAIHNNALSQEEMGSIVKALPNRHNAEFPGELSILNKKGYGAEENNHCSPQQIKEARDKNWKVLDNNGGNSIDYTSAERIKKNLPMHIYPNPASTYVALENLNPFEKVSLYTLNGGLIKEVKSDTEGKAQIKLWDIPKGSYIIKVEEESRIILIE